MPLDMGLKLLVAVPGPCVLAARLRTGHLPVGKGLEELPAGVAHLPAVCLGACLAVGGLLVGNRNHVLAATHAAGLLGSCPLEGVADIAERFEIGAHCDESPMNEAPLARKRRG